VDDLRVQILGRGGGQRDDKELLTAKGSNHRLLVVKVDLDRRHAIR
jgi:hypothetical protein